MPILRPLLEGTFDALSFAPTGSEGTAVVNRRASTYAEDLGRLSSDLALDPACGAYNEDAFRYFFEIERRRAEASGRPLLLLLIDLKKQDAPEAAIPAPTADRLFSSLSLCLRDTDFVGWYREGRVAGAVLTQHTEASETGIADLVAQRVTAALQGSLPPEVSIRVQVRVYHVPSLIAR
jgi:GGDEF domain-containing protein